MGINLGERIDSGPDLNKRNKVLFNLAREELDLFGAEPLWEGGENLGQFYNLYRKRFEDGTTLIYELFEDGCYGLRYCFRE